MFVRAQQDVARRLSGGDCPIARGGLVSGLGRGLPPSPESSTDGKLTRDLELSGLDIRGYNRFTFQFLIATV